MKQKSITCRMCGMTSYHLMDIVNEWCAQCHDYEAGGMIKRHAWREKIYEVMHL